MKEPQSNLVANPEVIRQLTEAIEVAKTQHMAHVAIAMVTRPNKAYLTYAGEVMLEEQQEEAVAELGKILRKSIDACTPPPENKKLDASFVCYNMTRAPLGFDFLTWLVEAEMVRVREGAPAPLKVGFWLGRDGSEQINADDRARWLKVLFRPVLQLIGAVEDQRAVRGRYSEAYTAAPIAAAARQGEKPPVLRSGLHRPMMGSYVTITLREAKHWPHRNSNLDAWLKFARRLKAEGENVIVIRDTECAEEPFPGFTIWPAASRDIQQRMRCYEHAKANLFVANGPCMLGAFSDRPWLTFTPVEDDESGYRANTVAFWKTYHGIVPGEQYPWSAPDQRIIWRRDNYDTICAAWDELKPLLASRQDAAA